MAAELTFWEFYERHFLAEHTHPISVGLHVIGTLAGLALVPVALTIGSPWWIVLFPVVHAAPGLLGHKLFEPNPTVGDLRVFRNDFPPLWFLFGNHVMTFNILTGRHVPFSK